MNSCTCEIERLENGFEVTMSDPEIVAKNNKPAGKGMMSSWQDPKKSYAFPDVKGVLAFLGKNLEKAMPMDEYSSSFDMAAKDMEHD